VQRNAVPAAVQHGERARRNGVPAAQRGEPEQRNAVPAAVQHGERERRSEARAAVQEVQQLPDAERRRPSVFQAGLIQSLLP